MPTQQSTERKLKQKGTKIADIVGIPASILGIIAGVFSFFPRLTISEPIQMNSADLFSYKMTVTNDGVTPFYVPVLMRVGWFCDRTWGGRSVAESGPSSAANSAGVLYPIPLCNLS